MLSLFSIVLRQAIPEPVTFNPSQIAEFSFVPIYNSSISLLTSVLSFNVTAGSVRAEIYTSGFCVQKFDNILSFQSFQVQQIQSQTYLLNIYALDPSATLTISFEQFQPLHDRTNIKIQVQDSQMQILALSCSNKPGKISAPGALLYVTSEAFYPDPSNCVTSATTFCGVEEIEIQDFLILRATLKMDSDVQVMYQQGEFISVEKDGIEQVQNVSESSLCYGFFKIDAGQFISNNGIKPYIKTVGIVASHVEPYKNGFVSIEVATDEYFEHMITSSISGQISLVNKVLQDFVVSQNKTIYIRTLQTSKDSLLNTKDNTVIKILFMPNLIEINSTIEYSTTLTPIQSNPDNVSLFEGSVISSINYMKQHPLVNIQSSTGQKIEPSYYYAGRLHTNLKDKSVVTPNLLTSTRNISLTSHNSQNFDFIESSFQSSAYLLSTAINPTEENIIPVGDVLFSTVQLHTVAAPSKVQVSLVEAQVIELQQKQKVDVFTVQSTNYFIINKETHSIQKGGINLKITVSQCTNSNAFTVYSSEQNPLPNILQYQNKYGQFDNQITLKLAFENKTSNQMFFSIQLESQSCQIQIQSLLPGEEVPIILQGMETSFSIDNSKTIDYQVELSLYQIYNRYGYIDISFDKSGLPSDSSLNFIILNQQVEGNILDIDEQYVLYKNSQQDSRSNFSFNTFQNSNIFIKFQITEELKASLAVKFSYMQVGVAGNINQVTNQEAPTELLNIYSYDSQYDEEIRIHMNNSVGVYFCKNQIPTLQNYKASCQQIYEAQKYFLIKDSFRGINYFGVISLGASKVPFNLRLIRHRVLELAIPNALQVYSSDLRFVTRINETLKQTDSIISHLVLCQSCAICYSKSNPEVKFNKLKQTGDCDLLILNTTTNQNFTDELLTVAGAKNLYGQIINYGQVGSIQEVIFTTNIVKRVMFDKMNLDYLGWTFKDSETIDNITFKPSVHYKFLIPKQQLIDQQKMSITVGPQLNEQQTGVSMITYHYAVYVSSIDKVPNQFNYQLGSDSEIGITVINFNRSMIESILENGCVSDTTCYLYVGVFAQQQSLHPYSLAQTYLAMNSNEKTDNIIEPLLFHTANNEGIKSNGNRTLYNFNIESKPMIFIMAPCKGWPKLRAGTTDYFYRSVGSNATLEKKENVFVSQNTYSEELQFVVKSSTRYSLSGDWFLEVGDFRTESSDWAADIFVGVEDPRPGIAIRTIQVQSGKQITVSFKPSIPAGVQFGQNHLEYNLFSLPNLKTAQKNNFVSSSACGFIMGGKQLLNDWVTFEEWQDQYELTSQNDFKLGDNEEYFITVVVRQKETQLQNSYDPIIIDRLGNLIK